MRNILMILVLTAVALPQGATHLVSRTSTGDQGNGICNSPNVSADGRFVVFQTNAVNLTGDPLAYLHVAIKDVDTGLVDVVSRTSLGQLGDAPCFSSGISSDDGRFVAFSCNAGNLVTPDANGSLADSFVKDRLTGAITRVSRSSAGIQADERMFASDMTPDGRWVTMWGLATNMDAGDTNGTWDVFLHDTAAGTTTMVSRALTGFSGAGASRSSFLSADGRYVVFDSSAPDLVAGDNNGWQDVFVRDTVAGTTTRVSVGVGGAESNGTSSAMGVSADGNAILYVSVGSNLVPNDNNGVLDLFVVDRTSLVSERVSIGNNGQEGNAAVQRGSISGDGRIVGFASAASNLDPADQTPQNTDLFIRDRLAGTTVMVTLNTLGVQGAIPCSGSGGQPNACGGQYLGSDLSGDGRFLVYDHTGGVLVPGVDANGASRDVMMSDWSCRLRSQGPVRPGTTVAFQFSAPLDGMRSYVGALSFSSNSGWLLGSRTIPLAPDFLFDLSLQVGPPVFVGFEGVLNASGQANAALAVPNDPTLVGLTFYGAFAVLDPTVPSFCRGISNALTLTVVP